MANPLEALALSFVKKELSAHPEKVGAFVAHILTQKGVDPAIVTDVQAFITEITPYLVQQVAP